MDIKIIEGGEVKQIMSQPPSMARIFLPGAAIVAVIFTILALCQ